MRTNTLLVLCIVISVLVSAGTFFVLRHLMDGEDAAAGGPAVPALVGMAPDQARTVLQSQGLVLIVSEKRQAPQGKAGQILSQQPPAGSPGEKGDLIQVVVGKEEEQAQGKATEDKTAARVPALAGLTLPAAAQALVAAGLSQGVVTRQASAMMAAEQVLSSAPAAGAEAVRGAAIALVVSSGTPTVAVPRVVGKSLGGAKRALTAAGFTMGKVGRRYDEDMMEGRILSQSPAAGQQAPGGSVIDLVVNAED